MFALEHRSNNAGPGPCAEHVDPGAIDHTVQQLAQQAAQQMGPDGLHQFAQAARAAFHQAEATAAAGDGDADGGDEPAPGLVRPVAVAVAVAFAARGKVHRGGAARARDGGGVAHASRRPLGRCGLRPRRGARLCSS